ncbi:hypothetical protein U9M48_033702 [Paspalum notatum var. saurae]|uniref:Uncharacterized protein n=1 Tax=Paspalum notatum var. saurae TaxID=547442 RepID=A0AAQ3U7J8_PASNO
MLALARRPEPGPDRRTPARRDLRAGSASARVSGGGESAFACSRCDARRDQKKKLYVGLLELWLWGVAPRRHFSWRIYQGKPDDDTTTEHHHYTIAPAFHCMPYGEQGSQTFVLIV